LSLAPSRLKEAEASVIHKAYQPVEKLTHVQAVQKSF
jgi:hypothetical protein